MNLVARDIASAPGANLSKPDAAKPALISKLFALKKRQVFIALGMAALLAFGIFVRVYQSATYTRAGYDEHGYIHFMKQIETAGVLRYDAVVQVFVEKQYQRPDAIVPATRIGFLVPAYLCGKITGSEPFAALRTTSCIASILLLVVCAVFAYRAGGTRSMFGLTLLVATAPLQIYLSQRALIDGYFAFWAVAAVWLAWENLQNPRHWGWLAAYALSLAVLVLTKENAAFAVFALGGVLLLNRFLKLGTVTPQLLAATVIGPAVAVLFLAWMVGGVWEWIEFYRMFVAKSRTNVYSIVAQDGPWYRYAVDFLLMSPLVVALALGHIFQLRKENRLDVFMTAFLALSFFAMANVTYGMSLRYAAYWEIPLCWLAMSQVFALSGRFPRVRPSIIAVGLLLIVAVNGLVQYNRFFIEGAIYDPTTSAMARASGLQK